MVTVKNRKIEPKDDAFITEAFVKAYHKADNIKSWMKNFDEKDLSDFLYIIFNEQDVYCYIVNETYLIVYTIAEPWYSKEKYLEECLVLRVYQTEEKFNCVTEFLNQEAIKHGCIGIYVATDMSTNNNVVSKLYQRCGFTEDSVKLYKNTVYDTDNRRF